MTHDAGHPRLSSAEIVAVTTELRHRQANRKKKKDTKGKETADDAKRELVMEEHKQSISELVADLGTDAVNVSDSLRVRA
jgi:sodium/potassium-transporting ATPase subunit alpha